MTSTSRSQRIDHLFKLLKKHYKTVPTVEGRSVLEHMLYACCLEDAKYEVADEIFAKLQIYFDWNEVRVTTVAELSEVMNHHPEPQNASARIKKNLQTIFETRYNYDIEDLKKQNYGKVAQDFEAWPGMSRFSIAYVVQHALGGHMIPLDNNSMQLMVALGIVNESEASKGQVPGLDRAITKQKGLEFSSMLHQLAADARTDHGHPAVVETFSELGVPTAQKDKGSAKSSSKKKSTPTKENTESVAEVEKPVPPKASAAPEAPAKPVAAEAPPKPASKIPSKPALKVPPRNAAKAAEASTTSEATVTAETAKQTPATPQPSPSSVSDAATKSKSAKPKAPAKPKEPAATDKLESPATDDSSAAKTEPKPTSSSKPVSKAKPASKDKPAADKPDPGTVAEKAAKPEKPKPPIKVNRSKSSSENGIDSPSSDPVAASSPLKSDADKSAAPGATGDSMKAITKKKPK